MVDTASDPSRYSELGKLNKNDASSAINSFTNAGNQIRTTIVQSVPFSFHHVSVLPFPGVASMETKVLVIQFNSLFTPLNPRLIPFDHFGII